MVARAVRQDTGLRMLTILVSSDMLSRGNMGTPAFRGTSNQNQCHLKL